MYRTINAFSEQIGRYHVDGRSYYSFSDASLPPARYLSIFKRFFKRGLSKHERHCTSNAVELGTTLIKVASNFHLTDDFERELRQALLQFFNNLQHICVKCGRRKDRVLSKQLFLSWELFWCRSGTAKVLLIMMSLHIIHKVRRDARSKRTRKKVSERSIEPQKITQKSPKKALAMCVASDLTLHSLSVIRNTACDAAHAHVFPSYNKVKSAKKESYPPDEEMIFTATSAEVALR